MKTHFISANPEAIKELSIEEASEITAQKAIGQSECQKLKVASHAFNLNCNSESREELSKG